MFPLFNGGSLGMATHIDSHGQPRIPAAQKESSNPVKQQPSGMPKSRGYRAEILAFTIGSGLLLIGIRLFILLCCRNFSFDFENFLAFLFPPIKHNGHGSQQITVQGIKIELTFHSCRIKKKIFLTVGLLLWFGMTFVMAEIIRRVCLFSEEIVHLNTRYDGSISSVVLHVFNSRNSANFFTVIILLSLLFVSQRSTSTTMFQLHVAAYRDHLMLVFSSFRLARQILW